MNPYLTAVVKRIDSIPYSEKYNLRAEALVRYAKGLFNEYSIIAQKLPNDINMGVAKLSEPVRLPIILPAIFLLIIRRSRRFYPKLIRLREYKNL